MEERTEMQRQDAVQEEQQSRSRDQEQDRTGNQEGGQVREQEANQSRSQERGLSAGYSMLQGERQRAQEESPCMQLMKEQFLWFWRTACLYAAVCTFCLYDNPAGITYPVSVGAMAFFSVLWLRKAGVGKKRGVFCYFTGMMLLGISTCLTTNRWIHFFNGAGILLLFCAAMLHQMYEDDRWSFPAYVERMLVFSGTFVASLLKPAEHMMHYYRKSKSRENADGKKNAFAILAGAGGALLFLLLVMPLLIQSDPVFAGYFEECFQKLNIGTVLRILLRFLSGFILFYAFFAALFRQNIKEYQGVQRKKVNVLTGITFTAILAFVYVAYSGTQISCLFLRRGLPENMTYSQYAHAGFWQLLAVTLINVVTVLVCVQVFEEHRAFQLLLLLISCCTCIMAVSAAYRMLLYVRVYHLTFLRVLVLWFLGVLVLIMCGIMLFVFRRKFPLFRYITAVVACCYIGFSMAGVDYQIALYNVRHTEQMNLEDALYLLYGLSEDAAPVVAELGDVKAEAGLSENDWIELEVEEYMRRISDGSETSLRKWNYAGRRAERAAEAYFED